MKKTILAAMAAAVLSAAAFGAPGDDSKFSETLRAGMPDAAAIGGALSQAAASPDQASQYKHRLTPLELRVFQALARYVADGRGKGVTTNPPSLKVGLLHRFIYEGAPFRGEGAYIHLAHQVPDLGAWDAFYGNPDYWDFYFMIDPKTGNIGTDGQSFLMAIPYTDNHSLENERVQKALVKEIDFWMDYALKKGITGGIPMKRDGSPL